MPYLLACILLLACLPMNALDISFDEAVHELRDTLATRGVPSEWFMDAVRDERFTMHPEVNDKFTRSAEARVDHTQEKDLDWYFRWFGVDAKVELGREFMAQNDTLLQGVEARYGIHPELVCAVLGMETNFAQERQKGTYYVFNSLVSQYVFMERRRNFALRELKSLYEFSRKSGRETYHFIGSFAGASGWGQFIPSSLLSFFVDANGNDLDIDIYSLEDNVHSIANYLCSHGLNAGNMNDEKARYSAVYAYNHSDAYVQAVLHIYGELRKGR